MSDAIAPPADPFAPDEPLECDIVMKGGITSGVVYPGAVVELAKRYRFRSIGGTSAGAIAAAIVAAAEHARRRGDTRGFEQVAALPTELAAEEGGRSLLLRLFQPDPETRPLFSVALGFIGSGAKGGALATLRAFPRGPALALAPAVALTGLAATRRVDPAVAVAGFAVGLVGAAGGLAYDVLRAGRRLSDNHFGLCTLGPQSVDHATQPALTTWLHERLQAAAGRTADDPVLTFADLWGLDPAVTDPEERKARLLHLSRTPGDRTVDLQMMTTDLTHGRPWRLPVAYQAYTDRLEQGGELLFEPDELKRFFPPRVVAHLEDLGRDPSPQRLARLAELAPGRTFKRFPIGPDLPVVVATRMSLSFPVLISAIPLWELDFELDPPPLRRVVFSDGGISSNFPVHLFDSPLPTRPTFGLHLTGFPPGQAPDLGDPDAAVVPPPAVNESAPEESAGIATLPQFLTAIKDAMQNWRDNVQARQPGFRDRMVHIRLGPEEGGLNLTMDSALVTALSARGAGAGRILVERFAGPPGAAAAPAAPWNQHRFVRFRIAMATTEELLRGFEHGYDTVPDAVTVSYPQLVAGGLEQHYKFTSPAQLDRAETTAEAYVGLVPDPGLGLGRGTPRPPSTLRIVPPV
jgi:predicted acylesterase/phospholipase RssA